MKFVFKLIFFAILLSYCLTAQNWKTVSNKDSTFFAAGYHGYGYISNYTTPNPHLLKVIFVDSSKVVNGDSVFYFYNTIRTDYRTQCHDTAAPSWLVRRFTLAADGTEHYFNSFSDTIIIKTRALVGDTWTLAKDSAGSLYRATISRVAVDTLDGVIDSIKTATIQALQNGRPALSPYNNLVLEWSKNHGWVKALDFYRFPNRLNPFTGGHFGAVIRHLFH